MKTIKYILFILCTIMFSCKKEVNQRFTASETQIVVNSFISPIDDSIRVQLDYSKNYFKENSDRNELVKNIGKATVVINDGLSDKKLVWSARNRHFHISKNLLPVIANRKYTLRINTFEGKTITAETTVPSPISVFDLVITSTYTKRKTKYNRINMNLQDEKGVNNYYRFALYTQIKYINPNYTTEDQYSEIDFKFLNDDKDLVTDIFLISEVMVPTPFSIGGQTSAEFYLKGFFEKGDEAYYRYLSTTKKNSESGENPFAEPTSVYTNIKGGLGVFSSYQRVEKSIKNN